MPLGELNSHNSIPSRFTFANGIIRSFFESEDDDEGTAAKWLLLLMTSETFVVMAVVAVVSVASNVPAFEMEKKSSSVVPRLNKCFFFWAWATDPGAVFCCCSCCCCCCCCCCCRSSSRRDTWMEISSLRARLFRPMVLVSKPE